MIYLGYAAGEIGYWAWAAALAILALYAASGVTCDSACQAQVIQYCADGGCF